MRSISRWIRSLLLVTALTPQIAHGQRAAALRAGDFTRISSAGRRTEGKIALVGRDSLTLVSDRNGTVTVPILTPDSVWIRQAHTGKGALIGAGLGGLALGGFAGLVTNGLCDAADCSGAFFDGFLVGGVIGAAGGGFIGAVIGSFIQGWRLISP